MTTINHYYILVLLKRSFSMNGVILGGYTGLISNGNPMTSAVALGLSGELRTIIDEHLPQANTVKQHAVKSVVVLGASYGISAALLAKCGVTALSLTPANGALAAGAMLTYGMCIYQKQDNFLTDFIRAASRGVLSACAFGWNPLALGIIFGTAELVNKQSTMGGNTVSGHTLRKLCGAVIGASLLDQNYQRAIYMTALLAGHKLLGHLRDTKAEPSN